MNNTIPLEIKEIIKVAAGFHASEAYAKAPKQSKEDAEYIQGVSKNSYIEGAEAMYLRENGRVAELEKENQKLKDEIKGWHSYKENIDQALNSGDGVYRP